MVSQKHRCSHCEYKAVKMQNLQTHIKSVHEGLKFQCPHCEHNATGKGHLQTHIKSVHEGQKRVKRQKTQKLSPCEEIPNI